MHASQASIQAAQQREEAEQRQAGVILEQKLCTTFGKLAANMPPAGNPRKNPSRAYDQNQHAILDELGTDLGCGQLSGSRETQHGSEEKGRCDHGPTRTSLIRVTRAGRRGASAG